MYLELITNNDDDEINGEKNSREMASPLLETTDSLAMYTLTKLIYVEHG